MAYNSYFPQFYQPMQQMPVNAPQMPSVASQSNNAGIVWVQGEAAAKAYPVGTGQAVLLMDSESSAFYIKSCDQSGMPQPLRVFDYTERVANASEAGIAKRPVEDYISRSEFDEFKEEMQKSLKGIKRPKTVKEDSDNE